MKLGDKKIRSFEFTPTKPPRLILQMIFPVESLGIKITSPRVYSPFSPYSLYQANLPIKGKKLPILKDHLFTIVKGY